MTNDTPRGLAVAWLTKSALDALNECRDDDPPGYVEAWTRRDDENAVGLILATDYAALLAEVDALRERLRAVEGDAERWRYARRFLAGDDIEKWPEMLKGGHKPSEAGNLWADAAIDAVQGRGE